MNNFELKIKFFRLFKSKNGFGIIESIVAVAITVVVGFFFLGYIQQASRDSIKVGALNQCEGSLNTLMTAIRSQDNSLNIRTWIPKNITVDPRPTTPNSIDPFCNSNRTNPVCDTVPHLVMDPGDIIPLTLPPVQLVDTNSAQNWRGSTSYLLSLYNTFNPPYSPSICTGEGLTFTGAPSSRTITQLLQNLPTNVDLNNLASFTQIGLFVQQIDQSGIPLPCNATESTANPRSGVGFEVRIHGTYVDKTAAADPLNPTNPALKSCSVQGRFYYPKMMPPSPLPQLPLPVFTLRNINNEPIDEDECTCQDSLATVVANGNSCPEMLGIKVDIQGVPAGILPGCYLQGPAFGATAGVRYCPQNAQQFIVNGTDLTGGGAFTSYNAPGDPPTNVIVGWGPLIVDAPYATPLEAARNSLSVGYIFPDGRWNLVTRRFKVAMPNCPNPNTYCAGFQPPGGDGCGGACPAGTMPDNCPAVACGTPSVSSCSGTPCPIIPCGPCMGCTDPSTFCGAPVPAMNGCNPVQPCPAGTNCPTGGCPVPGLGCAAPTTFCGAPTAPATDSCGNACPTGISCPPPITCTDPNTFCGPPDGSPAQPLLDSFGATCPDGSSCGPPVICPMRCGDPNQDAYCQSFEVACDPDPHACVAGAVYIGCFTQPNGCGTCEMAPGGCPCVP